MAGRKRNWNILTPDRYKGKVERTNRGVYINPATAEEVAEKQTQVWQAGSEPYRRLREIAKRVMESSDFHVTPSARAPYYAYLQKWYKEVIVIGLDEGNVEAFLSEKFPDLRAEVIDEVKRRIRGEVGVEVQRAAERA